MKKDTLILPITSRYFLPCALLTLIPLTGYANEKTTDTEKEKEDVIMVYAPSAEDMLKQQLGVSTITSEDIEKNPPVNDLSDIIRTQPGVNLTGNSSSGARGNNRQIDIRGMGPENTLILIDGKPVTSRNSVRYSWSGERDSRGDSNWVPAEQVERIEVIRGPAAARYGSGAAGGVINIVTKKPTEVWNSSISLYGAIPQHSKYGDTERINLSTSGQLIKDVLSMRLYGNFNRTDADEAGINAVVGAADAAGREGVTNKDVRGSLIWSIANNQYITFDAGYSRQGNIYTGDTQNSSSTAITNNLAKEKAETNKMYRQNYSIAYDGYWGFGETKLTVQYDRTNNTRLQEGLAGRYEGAINTEDTFTTSRLKNYFINGEAIIPIEKWVTQTLTLGSEFSYSGLNDPGSTAQTDALGLISSSVNRAESDANISSVYVEDSIEPFVGTNIIPALRFDYHNKFGANLSPGLNISQQLGKYFTLKAGIARAFKAPNLYQSNTGYLLYTRGNGCPLTVTSDGVLSQTTGGCYLQGNDDLNPEISINQELGIAFEYADWQTSLTYFRNDYQNKIIAGSSLTETTNSAGKPVYITQWENTGPAIVEGLEGNVRIPVLKTLSWSTNMTYMIQSIDKTTGNPLSIIPKFTINSTLDWVVTDTLSTFFKYTQYGKQTPKKYATNYLDTTKEISSVEVYPYALFGIGANYKITANWRVNVGIDNLLDTQIYRQAKGASTYNEAGRYYYLATTYSF